MNFAAGRVDMSMIKFLCATRSLGEKAIFLGSHYVSHFHTVASPLRLNLSMNVCLSSVQVGHNQL